MLLLLYLFSMTQIICVAFAAIVSYGVLNKQSACRGSAASTVDHGRGAAAEPTATARGACASRRPQLHVSTNSRCVDC